jgi:hypothetical protein
MQEDKADIFKFLRILEDSSCIRCLIRLESQADYSSLSVFQNPDFNDNGVVRD